jgi:hypothetical protein
LINNATAGIGISNLTMSTSQTNIAEAQWDPVNGPGNFEFWTNRTADTPGTQNASISAGTTIRLGAPYPTSGNSFNGYIGEWLVFDVSGGISSGNRTTNENDQHTFYSTP